MTLQPLHTLGAPGGDEPVDRRLGVLGARGRRGVGARGRVPVAVTGRHGDPRGHGSSDRGPRLLWGWFRRERPASRWAAGRGRGAWAGHVRVLRRRRLRRGSPSPRCATRASCWAAPRSPPRRSHGPWIVGAGAERAPRRTPRCSCASGLSVIVCGIGLMILVAQADVPAATAGARVGGRRLRHGTLVRAGLARRARRRAERHQGTASAALALSDTLGVALGTGMSGAIVAAGAAFAGAAPPRRPSRRALRHARDRHRARRGAAPREGRDAERVARPTGKPATRRRRAGSR